MRPAHALLALLALALVAVGAFLLAGDSPAGGDGGGGPGGVAAPDVAAPDVAAPDVAAREDPVGPAAAVPVGETAVASTAPSGSEPGARTAVAAGGEPVVVELIDRDGTPLDGVELIVLDRARYDRSAFQAAEDGLAEGDGPARAELLRRFGLALGTDARGRAGFAWSGEWSEVHALLPWGVESERLRRSRLEDGVLRFVVRVPELAVRVVGPDGEGVAGLPVMFADRPLGEETGSTGPQGGWFRVESGAALTDADGLAFPANAGIALAMGRESLVGGFVRVAALTADGPEVEVPPDHGPATPVVVVLPPTAPVVVEVTDAAGTRIDEPVMVQLAVGDRPLESAGQAYTVASEPLLTRMAVDGRARFEHVAVGLPLVATAVSESRGTFRSRAVAGPTRAGEPLRVTLDLPAQRLVSLRVLGPDGRPLAEENVRVAGTLSGPVPLSLPGPMSGPDWRNLRTGDDGRLVLTVEDGAGKPWATLELSTRIDGAALTARVELPAALPLATTDLGDARLEPVAPLASGIVLLPDGSPAVGAEVEVVRSFGDGESLDPDDWWRAANTASTRADDEGAFVLREAPLEEHLALVASLDGLRSTEVRPFERGAEGLVLRLAATGSLSARLVHRGMDGVGSRIGFRLVRDGDDPDRASTTYSSTARHTFDGLEPGLYDLYLVANGAGATLHRIEDLVVVAGQPCGDPRLDPVDLTDLLPLVEITVRAPSGEAVEDWTLGRRTSEGRYRTEFHQGPARVFLIDGRPLEGFVSASGYAPVDLERVVDDVTVTLGVGLEVELELVGLALGRDPRAVEVVLYSEPGDEASEDERARARALRHRAKCDGDGRARVVLPGSGSYRAQLAYTTDLGEGSSRTSFYDSTTLEVPPTPVGALSLRVSGVLSEDG